MKKKTFFWFRWSCIFSLTALLSGCLEAFVYPVITTFTVAVFLLVPRIVDDHAPRCDAGQEVHGRIGVNPITRLITKNGKAGTRRRVNR